MKSLREMPRVLSIIPSTKVTVLFDQQHQSNNNGDLRLDGVDEFSSMILFCVCVVLMSESHFKKMPDDVI